MKKFIYIVLPLFISLAILFIFPFSTLADNLPNGVKPEQGKASGTLEGQGGSYSYIVTFWNVGELGGSEYGKATLQVTCLKQVGGCPAQGGNEPVGAIFSGGPNGTLTVGSSEDHLIDGKYFEMTNYVLGTWNLSVENPGVFDGWKNPPTTTLEDSGAGFSDLAGQVEVNIPNSDGTYNDENWTYAKLKQGQSFPVGTHIKTGNDGKAVITFADMSTFTLKPNTEAVLSSPVGRESVIKLIIGKMWANIKKMAKDGSMEVEMSQAAATIKGTRFILTETGLASTIQVTEGSVQFTSKNGNVATVVKGESVTATGNGLSAKTTFNPEEEESKWSGLVGQNPKISPVGATGLYFLGGVVVAVLIFVFFVIKKNRKSI